MSQAKPRPGRAWLGRPSRPVFPKGLGTPPGPWIDEQISLARDISALLNRGLIVSVEGGSEVRYAVSADEEQVVE